VLLLTRCGQGQPGRANPRAAAAAAVLSPCVFVGVLCR